MVSDSGDYIGGGQFYYFTSADGNFTQQGGSTQHVSIDFTTPSYAQWWYLDFAAPSGQSLAPGNYTGATRYPFQASNQPGLSIVGDGRGCNTLTGSFQILQASFTTSGMCLPSMPLSSSTVRGARPRFAVKSGTTPLLS
jgi:hypothetical protein